MEEVLETLEGCVAILANVEEDHHDARLWVVMESLKSLMEKLDE